MNLKLVILGIVAIAGIVSFLVTFSEDVKSDSEIIVTTATSDVMITEGKKHIIPLDEIRGGGPPKDGIPSIDDPKFVTINDSQFVSDDDMVIGLSINGEAKAYPLFILVWHEIVNDDVGGIPVAVTYCPLCYTNQVFDRTLDGAIVEFGTSGKLYNSNLVMYDRLTDSYWSQGLGLAITGELSGNSLNTIPFDVITWGDWKELHQDTLVLTTDTGHIRSYNTDPYGSYYTNPQILFPVDNQDDRIPLKEIIVGFHQDDIFKAYKQSDVESNAVINDVVDDSSILVVSMFEGNSRIFDRMVNDDVLDFTFEDGLILDTNTKSVWNYEGKSISGALKGEQLSRLSINPGFWFSWISFHPDTLVYGDES